MGPDRRLAIGLAVVACLPFLPTLQNGFVDWDDTTLLVGNHAYRGFGPAELRWMFTTALLGHYAPVTWLTWALDYRLWGLSPTGFHLTSLVLHGANVALFTLVALRLLRAATTWSDGVRRVAAAVAALAWGIHPLRVETVAWATERRGVLAGFFCLLTVLAYLRAADPGARRGRWLAAAIGSYALALGAKASVMTLPAVLLVLDVYPLRRLPAPSRAWLGRSAWPVLREKVPFVALGLAAGFLSSVTQARGADAAMLDTGTWIALVGRTLWFHVVKTLLPVGLSAVYQLPVRVPLDDPTVLVSGAGVLAISLATVSLASRWPAGLAVWLVYGALLAPVMGLMHAGFQVTADRYGYLPCLGLSLLVGAAAGGLCRAGAAGRLRPAAGGLLLIAGLAGLGGLGVLTWRQTGVWRDNWTLWAHAVDAAPECALCRTNLGVELLARGGPAEALTQFRMALAVRPESARAHGNIGRALAALGRHAEAVPHYEIMLARYPRQVDVRTHLATTLLYLGRREEAVAQMRLAARAGDAPDATAYFGRVLAERPGSLAARLGLAEVHLAAGRIELARRELELIRAGDPPLAAILQSGLPAGSGPAR